MEDLIGPLILLIIAVVAVFYVVWILLATALRIIAWVVFYWAVSFSIGFVAGLLTGFVVPFQVLRGRSETTPAVATPDAVASNQVITHAPRGFSKHHGWDRAWPVYNPYQARRDAAGVKGELGLVLGRVWAKVSSGVSTPTIDTTGSGTARVTNVSASLLKSAPGIVWGTFVPIPYFGFWAGARVSYGMWLLMMLFIGGVIYAGQQAFTLGYRGLDKGRLLRARASVRCPKCFSVSPRPSYRCLNSSCGIVHHDVTPGPLGMLHRRCECGTAFPTTVGAAAKVLEPLCPVCGADLAEGSGARQTIQLPAFGGVGAGKTRLFYSLMTAAGRKLAQTGGALEGLGVEARAAVNVAENAMERGLPSEKTLYTARPEGIVVTLTDGVGKVAEVQFMDAAGESFQNWHSTEELTYVNTAETMVFVLDPLAFPRLGAELNTRRPFTSNIIVASGDQEAAYASVADRLRSENVDLNRRQLAVVLPKADIWAHLPSGASLDPSTSDTVRHWLIEQEQDGFVRRIESDFGKVHYFAVDSLVLHDDDDDPLNPLRVLAWVFENQKVPVKLMPQAIDAAEQKASV